MAVPGGALAGAAVSAAALAGIVDDFVSGLPMSESTAMGVVVAMRRVVRVSAPRITVPADVAAISTILIVHIQAGARAATPRDAADRLYEAAARSSGAYPASASPALTREYGLARALAAGVETACLGEAFLAEARTAFPDRQAATEARNRITAAMDGATDRIAAILGQPTIAVLSAAARECSAFLVRNAADLQPIVSVDAMRSYPSTAVAWALYGDPQRAGELIERNRVGTPLFMPASIEAISPKAS